MFRCPYCEATFNTTSELMEHISSAHPQNVTQPTGAEVATTDYGWTAQGQAQQAAQAYRDYIESIITGAAGTPEETEGAAVCPYCGASFADYVELMSHMQTEHMAIRQETISQGGWDYLVGYDAAGNIVSQEALGRTEAGEMTPSEQAVFDWQREQAAQEQRLNEQYLAWQRQQAEFEQQESRRQYLAQLAARPVSWLEYAAYAGEPPAIQPWMQPLMPQQYQQLGAGEIIPGYGTQGAAGRGPGGIPQTPGYGWLPELTRPSRQYQARMGPTAQQQLYGYEQARTGARPEETQFRLWSQAPPSGQYRGLTRAR